jgi:alpha-tubulin suppressor-like RCC1 family protein
MKKNRFLCALIAGMSVEMGCSSNAGDNRADAMPDGMGMDSASDADVNTSVDVGPDRMVAEIGVDAAEIGVDAIETGVDATETGVDAAETGVDAAETGVDRPADVTDGATSDVPVVPTRCEPCVGAGCAIVEVSVGSRYTCARRAAGSVTCWGDNALGQLGNGTRTPSSTPTEVLGVCDAVEVEAGSNAACARRRSGQISCWGSNISGVLGVGRSYEMLNSSATALEVADLTDVTSIDGGAGFFCVIRRGGAVWCWGSNSESQLGIGTAGDTRSSPLATMVTDATYLSTTQTGCAVRTSGQIVCWGNNYFGRLGNGTTTNSSVPVVVSGITDAIAVATGVWHTCALRAGGTVSCWGDNTFAMLGSTPSTTFTLSPVGVSGITGARQIEIGRRHTCVILADNTVSCWGKNTLGELGRGMVTSYEITPAPVMGLTGVSMISSHSAQEAMEGGHTCAVRANGTVACWGMNDIGQLGDGTTTSRAVPVNVSF